MRNKKISESKYDSNTVIVTTAGGALLGNMIVPGVGGAIIGGLLGLMLGIEAKKREQNRALDF